MRRYLNQQAIPWDLENWKPGRRIVQSYRIKTMAKDRIYARAVVCKNLEDLRKVLIPMTRHLYADPKMPGIITDETHAICLCTITGVVHRRTGQEAELIDPKFFAVMGFIQDKLCREYVIHECVHAAHCYHRRRPNYRWVEGGNPEEEICYPAGRLADMLIRNMEQDGLLNP